MAKYARCVLYVLTASFVVLFTGCSMMESIPDGPTTGDTALVNPRIDKLCREEAAAVAKNIRNMNVAKEAGGAAVGAVIGNALGNNLYTNALGLRPVATLGGATVGGMAANKLITQDMYEGYNTAYWTCAKENQ